MDLFGQQQQHHYDAKPSSAYSLRNKHSLTFAEHNSQTAETYKVRSAHTLINRGPSYPAQVVDTTTELVRETVERRHMHKQLFETDTSGFKKKALDESSTMVLNEKNALRHMIGDLHQIKDPLDINKARKFTYSRVGKREEVERERPMEDFLQPENQTRVRSAGYNQGHIRSILGLDSYGPNSSMKNQMERSMGLKPPSPNIDRHSREGRSRSPQNRPNTSSTMSSRSSGRATRAIKGGESSNIQQLILTEGFGQSIELKPAMVGTNKDVMAGTLGFYGEALTYSERMQANNQYKGSQWFQSYKKGLQDEKDIRSLTKKMKEHRSKMNREAEQERRNIEEFEFRLESAKISNV